MCRYMYTYMYIYIHVYVYICIYIYTWVPRSMTSSSACCATSIARTATTGAVKITSENTGSCDSQKTCFECLFCFGVLQCTMCVHIFVYIYIIYVHIYIYIYIYKETYGCLVPCVCICAHIYAYMYVFQYNKLCDVSIFM